MSKPVRGRRRSRVNGSFSQNGGDNGRSRVNGSFSQNGGDNGRPRANSNFSQNRGDLHHAFRSGRYMDGVGRGRYRDDDQSQGQKFTNGNRARYQNDFHRQIQGLQSGGVDRNLILTSSSSRNQDDRFQHNSVSSSSEEGLPYSYSGNGQTFDVNQSDSVIPPLCKPVPDAEVASVSKIESQSAESPSLSSTNENPLSAVTASGRRMPKRPGVGTLGRQIQVKINYFPLTIPHGNVYHYDVEICNERDFQRRNNQKSQKKKGPGATICRKVMDTLLKAYKEVSQYYPAYDGKKNLITRRELPFSGERTFKVLLEDESKRQETFMVKIKAVKNENEEHIISLNELHDFIAGKIEKTPSRAIMALDIIMRHIPSIKLTPIGKSLFHPPTEGDLHPLSGGREVWFGYHQSVRPTAWKMMVNIDKAATTFYESQPILHLVGQILSKDHIRIQKFTPLDIKILTKELRDLRIKVTHQTYGRKYRIYRVTTVPLSELTFPIIKNNVTIHKSVVEYFKEQYNYHCKFSHLSGLDVGTKDSPKYLPMEVCNIVEGQHCKKKLSDKQTSEMIRFTVIKPEDRFKEIEEAAKKTVEYNEAYMKEFGLQMNTKCIEATARVLKPPRVLYEEKEIEPKEGKWDMKQKRFFKGVEINSWVLISMSRPDYCTKNHLEKFSDMLFRIANAVGIKMPRINAESIKILKRRENIVSVLKSFHNVDLAIIVLPKNASGAYSDIKQTAETQIGLKTQCLRDGNLVDPRKCTDALISNLCQKINAKMGGVNCALGQYEKPEVLKEILKRPVIFMGADVTHPSPGDKTSVSIAAVVGSLDAHPSRYAVSVRVQCSSSDVTARRIEIIQDLKNMTKELLREFYCNTGQKKPEKIIFYRDGVSEGEFQKVQEEEVMKIREACSELEEGYEPGITFIVVGKRHHMRMMPANRSEGVGPARNVPPGTYVDTAVVHPSDFDFFLCSHYGIQGTSRPSHYTILWDDNDFTANEIQKLSYYLCHVYVRCTRSISIPSPVQYAHLAAARAKQHLISKMEVNSSSGSDSSGEQTLLTESLMNSVYVVEGFNTTMYYV